MVFLQWPAPFLMLLALSFYYFVLAGGRVFELTPSDVWAAGLAQFSFLVTGTFGTLAIGFRAVVPIWNVTGSAVLLLCSLLLYEWARRTIRGRRFHIAWSGEVPDVLCDEGPYKYVRHPIYASYILAFAAMLTALPTFVPLAIFAFNVALFIHAAISDERAIAASGLAADYARYRLRTGMFLPRLSGRRAA